MSKIVRLNESAVRCPLCHEFFVKKYDSKSNQFILACDSPMTCGIAIAIGDPFIGLWDKALERSAEKIECVRCNANMTRYFCTATGFIKVVCVRKKMGKLSVGYTFCSAVSNAEPDREANDKTPDNLGVLQ